MKHANVYQPFFLSSFQRIHTLTLNDLKWTAFEAHDFLGDGEDWALVMENMLLEKNPELLKKITFGDERDMFCIRSEDKDALHEICEMVAAFYEDRPLLEATIEQYAKY
ncbi:MAG: hypothetical protein ACJAZP_003469 [Psychromonas sp.]|jgi:hypothetical protein|uniref:Imm51 family immunity protein n=1 Tax=Psychromonas sp. TaxID=1884585 RepID=UPI0039E58937